MAAWTPSPLSRSRTTSPSSSTRPAHPSGARWRRALAELAGQQIELTCSIGGKRVMARRDRIDVPQPHARRHVLGTTAQRHPRRRRGGGRGRPGGRRRAGASCRSTSAPPCSCGRRPAGRPVAGQTINAATMLGQSKTALPGRDRRRLRARRLLAVQRRTSRRQILAEQPMSRPRGLEPHRPPPAGGLRLRDHAVQLHRDRRQPADRAGADGQHRRVEAVAAPSRSPRT